MERKNRRENVERVISVSDFIERLDAIYAVQTANANTCDDSQTVILAGFIVIIA